MGLSPLAKSWRGLEPPLGVRVNPLSRLGRGLAQFLPLNEAAGGTLADATGAPPGALSGPYSWSRSAGKAGVTIASGAGAYGQAAPVSLARNEPWTMAWRFSCTSYTAILLRNTSGSAGFNIALNVGFPYSGTSQVYFYWGAAGGGYIETGGAPGLLASTIYDITITHDGSGTLAGLTFYQDSAVAAKHAGNDTLGADPRTSGPTYLLDVPGGGGGGGTVYRRAVWKGRCLTAAEVASYNRDPSQVFSSPGGIARWLDTVASVITRALSETLSLSDARAATLGRVVAEAVALLDGRAANMGRGLADGLTLADSRATTAGKSALEALTLNDARASSLARALADVLSLLDSAAASRLIAQALSETLPLTDARRASSVRALADTLALSDARFAALTRAVQEALGLSDVAQARIVVAALLALLTKGGGIDGDAPYALGGGAEPDEGPGVSGGIC